MVECAKVNAVYEQESNSKPTTTTNYNSSSAIPATIVTAVTPLGLGKVR